jgi:hypothetical protein
MSLIDKDCDNLPDDEMIEDEDEDENVETFYYTDENGYWEENTIFNEDGVALDSDGNPLNDNDYQYKNDFDYSPFELDDEDTDER